MKEKIDSDQLSVVSKKPEDYFFRASAEDFKKISGSPIAYNLGKATYDAYGINSKVNEFGETGSGLQTSDNNRFLRQWYEISFESLELEVVNESDALLSEKKWFPHKKGGPFRKWYGNNDYVLNWKNGGKELFNFARDLYGSPTRIIKNTHRYYQRAITWSHTTSSRFSARLLEAGFIFNVESPALFDVDEDLFLPYLCSTVGAMFIEIANPTLHFVSNSVGELPFAEKQITPQKQNLHLLLNKCLVLSKLDWNSYETSWDFTVNPLLKTVNCTLSTDNLLSKIYAKLRAHWQEMTLETQRLEKENNSIFIEAYGLQDELTPEVPLNEITLTCNPHYRYKGNKTEQELEALLLADTMKEFLFYAVGCMFGRYSLDKPGLILANQGETVDDYLNQVPTPTFAPDADNVIPILDGDWFSDDLTSRFSEFLKVTFGEDHYEENLKFITDAIGKDIRKYFLKNFYTDHVKRYKKRPIYWLFASPKGSFNALIYMHRYQPDTASIILNDYLREFRTKFIARREHLEQVSISASATKTEKTKALKQIEKLKKTIEELDTYENEILYPLATEKIEIDLDDGVKVNYKKFGKALKKVAGLS